MKICQKCQKEFNPRCTIRGKLRCLYKRKFCLDCSPYGNHNTSNLLNPTPQATIEKITAQEFETLVKTSTSRSDIFVKLRLRKGGEAFKIINRRLKRESVDISHFIKGGRNGGNGNNRLYSNEEVYCINSKIKDIRCRVLSDKIMLYKCCKCKNDGKWMNDDLTLELDHINGDRYDNRKENLRWLCPNCHSQTTTFCGKRKRLTF